MKKTYVKPYLAVESFQLNAAIAASCSSQGFTPLGKSETDCPHDSGWFSDGVCAWDATGGDGKFDEPCYHGPTATGGMTFVYS